MQGRSRRSRKAGEEGVIRDIFWDNMRAICRGGKQERAGGAEEEGQESMLGGEVVAAVGGD